jgi:hypothetical protein
MAHKGWVAMCCQLDHVHGKLLLQTVHFEEDNTENEKKLHVSGFYDRTPKTLGDRFSRYFHNIELVEKIAEIVDESFHLFSSLLQHFTDSIVYQTVRDLHHAAHHIEHILHPFCFFGDIVRLLTGKFFENRNEEHRRLNLLRNVARVCHAVAHFFANVEFLHKLKLCRVGQLDQAFKYAPLLSAAGYALWTISLIWERYLGIKDENFASDMSLHFGGFLFKAIPFTEHFDLFTPYTNLMHRASSLAGIVHAWFVAQRLMTPDREHFETHIILSNEEHT